MSDAANGVTVVLFCRARLECPSWLPLGKVDEVHQNAAMTDAEGIKVRRLEWHESHDSLVPGNTLISQILLGKVLISRMTR